MVNKLDTLVNSINEYKNDINLHHLDKYKIPASDKHSGNIDADLNAAWVRGASYMGEMLLKEISKLK